MSEHRQIPEPGELVYQPEPSWAPAFFAFAAALAVVGVFVGDSFMLPGWFYSLIGGIVMLATLRHMARSASASFFRLPRRQRARGAVLPVQSFGPPKD